MTDEGHGDALTLLPVWCQKKCDPFKKMKSCQVYTTKKNIFILCLHKTPGGTWRALDPMLKLDKPNLSTELIGESVNKVLAASTNLVAAPDFDIANMAMLSFLGYNSWGKFANAVESSCFVDLDRTSVKITPTFRDGRGFSGDKKNIVTCEPTIESIGKALFTVLELEG